VFASYHVQGGSESSAPVMRSPGAYFESGKMILCRRMSLGTEEIGSVYIESDTAELTERYRRYLAIMAGVMALSWLAALLAASRLHRTITQPLTELIQVARNIVESGDLDQEIKVDRKDELGELGRSFSAMVVYLKEMATLSEAIAGGDLTVRVEPRSSSDVLGNAFANMLSGLRNIVLSVRQAAGEAVNGSGKMANTSGESAKASMSASSAINEVTSTIEEMTANVEHVAGNTQVQAQSVSETSSSIQQMVASIKRVTDTANVLMDI